MSTVRLPSGGDVMNKHTNLHMPIYHSLDVEVLYSKNYLSSIESGVFL